MLRDAQGNDLVCEDWTVDGDGDDVDRNIDATAKDTAKSETVKTLSTVWFFIHVLGPKKYSAWKILPVPDMTFPQQKFNYLVNILKITSTPIL